ncbi:MAG: molybdopterin-guanine dinucleotide biosynthesis protein B [Gemmatimonadaceae bacterium]
MPRPPMVAVIGKKHSGKTTLAVRLSAALGRRGHRVMAIKHGSHTFNIDPSTTDTYRHYHEGEVIKVAMAAPDKFALVERWSEEMSPEAIAERYMGDASIVVCEGFKRSALPKIEVFRTAVHPTPLYAAGDADAARYVAIVTDAPDFSAVCPVVSYADADWLERLVAIVEREVIA